jgi:serine/threonine protein kinase
MADLVGHQLGHYRLTDLLGAGGFAEVYLADHLYLKTQVAIKVLHTRLTQEDQEHFLSEAQTIAQLRHPRIVQIFDFGIEGGTPYLVMDYAPGGTLRQRHPRGTRLLPANILAYVKQTADALQYAHDQRLIHRDIKPENLLLGRTSEILLSDFGIATIAQTTSDLKTQGFSGTATYAAPEQLRGKPVQASDQYALGVMVYEWLSGSPPFSGSLLEVASQQVFSPPPPLHEKVPEIVPAVEQVVMTALSKEPRERFGSVRAFATAIEQAMQTTLTTLETVISPAAPGAARPEQPDEASIYSAPTQQTPLTSAAQSGEASIYSASTQLSSTPPSAQPADLPTYPAQSAPAPSDTLVPPAVPAEWASAALVTTSSLDDTFTSPPPGPGRPDARKSAASGVSVKLSQYASSPARQRRLSKGRVALLVLLVALIIGGGVLTSAVIIQNQATSAAQASGTATAQTQANMQASATANAAATESAQAQATAGVLQTATTGQPDYIDPLTNGNTTNQTWMKDGTSCFFASDGYHVYTQTPTQGGTGSVCRETDRSFQNATIAVEMNLHGGYSGGLIFRWLENQAYFFEVGAGGNYHIGVLGSTVPLRDWTDSPAIHKGLYITNTIQVMARGNVLMFYVNGAYLTTVMDSTVGAGVIGLFNETDTSGPGDAVFSNLKVYVAP